MILWAIVGPVGASLLAGAGKPVLWFLGYASLVVMSGLLQPLVRPPDPPVPQGVIVTFSVLNIVGVSVTLFMVLV